MDSEDLLTRALEPGEKVVWSDRPHIALWPPTAPLVLAALGWLCAAGLTVAGLAEYLALWRPSVLETLLPLAVLVVVGSGFALGSMVLCRIRESFGRYAVTDRGRVIAVTREGVRASPLPSPDAITTHARGNQEFGDIAVGPDLVLRRVSYPLIALESIRAAASASNPRTQTDQAL